jgi:hypothetical protein
MRDSGDGVLFEGVDENRDVIHEWFAGVLCKVAGPVDKPLVFEGIVVGLAALHNKSIFVLEIAAEAYIAGVAGGEVNGKLF